MVAAALALGGSAGIGYALTAESATNPAFLTASVVVAVPLIVVAQYGLRWRRDIVLVGAVGLVFAAAGFLLLGYGLSPLGFGAIGVAFASLKGRIEGLPARLLVGGAAAFLAIVWIYEGTISLHNLV